MPTKEDYENRTKEEQEQAERLYNLHIKEILRRYASNVEHYDKALLTLSSSSLGFSLLAIRYIVPWETASFLSLLILAWFLMAISITTSLIAYRIGNKALKKAEKNATDYYLHGIKGANERENPYIEYNRRLNNWTKILFVISMFLILLFVSLNIIC